MSLLGGGTTYTYAEVVALVEAVRQDYNNREQDNTLDTATPIAALCMLAGLKAADVTGGGT